jgi:hypothetical protein
MIAQLFAIFHTFLPLFSIREKIMKFMKEILTKAEVHANIYKLTICEGKTVRPGPACGCSTMARAPAFQAGDASSILVTRSIYAPVAQLDRAAAF